MMDFFNQVVTTVAQLVVAGAGTAFMVYGIPYLKKIGVYKLVQMTVRAAEKVGATGVIKKADKNVHIATTPLYKLYHTDNKNSRKGAGLLPRPS